MSAAVAKAQLLDALRQFRTRWHRVRQSWDDDARRRFEAEFLDPLEPQIAQAVRAMEQVAELIQQARRACDDGT